MKSPPPMKGASYAEMRYLFHECGPFSYGNGEIYPETWDQAEKLIEAAAKINLELYFIKENKPC